MNTHFSNIKEYIQFSRCSFSMMVRWVNEGVLQAYATKMLVNNGEMLVNDGEMLVNDGEMSKWSYTHFTIINEHFTIINEHLSSIGLKYTIIRSSDHHWEAAPTAIMMRLLVWLHGIYLNRIQGIFSSNIDFLQIKHFRTWTFIGHWSQFGKSQAIYFFL